MINMMSMEAGRDGVSVKPRSNVVLATTLLLLSSFTLTSQALETGTVCGPEVKEEVAKAMGAVADADESKKLAVELQIYNQYAYCAQDIELDDSFIIAAKRCGAKVSNLGSRYYEEMSCCGYDPQRRQFACPVKIKRAFGFGGAPLPGSREYVLHCVADSRGTLVPVGFDSVHLANEMHGSSPSWQFAVIANANQNLHTIYPMNGQTRRARSILSWGLRPTSCNYRPIWGNALNYAIRLDQ
ncbi:MAG: hypothetical protein KZQ76_04255 [Candidatus Thiodiazotropha sp. (ex Epidulcina cf. delphinae)]|nr:hypothetical protein [Candidatus Thiodiazotropha sp. (ex Epidulcina cf. delphinae)]